MRLRDNMDVNVSTPIDLSPQKPSQITLHPGMACRTPHGHPVRIMQILHAESEPSVADVHLLRNPRQNGELYLSELTPIPVKVMGTDQVLLHIGNLGMPIQARVVEVSGDYALFFSPNWNEALWGHTAHVLSIAPRGRR
jgi:hypothetical protein